MVRLLVIGASRGIGLETVKAARAVGHDVRALARSEVPVQDPAIEVVRGDALDPAAMRAALQDVDAVVQALGAPTRPEVYIGGTDLFSKATRILVDAMTEIGPRRLVVVTGLGAGDSRGHGGFLYGLMFGVVLDRIYRDKDVQEMIVKRSNLDWTIVRPGKLTDGPATGRIEAITDPKHWRGGTVSRADVARFLVEEIAARRFVGQTPVLIDN